MTNLIELIVDATTSILLATAGLIVLVLVSYGIISAIVLFADPLRLSHQTWFSLITIERLATNWIFFGEKWFRITLWDNNVRNWLKNLVSQRRSALEFGQIPVRLVTFRKEFQRIVKRERLAGLVW